MSDPKPIGPTFARELGAAGLLGLPFAWAPDGTITFDPAISDAQRTAIEAVYGAHDPTAVAPEAVYAAKIAAGIQIVSTGTPALSGTYAVTDAAIGKLDGIIAGINAGKGLPGGGGTFNYPDVTGAMHAFDATSIVNLAAALRDYLYALIQTEAALIGGHAAEWPSLPVTIA